MSRIGARTRSIFNTTEDVLILAQTYVAKRYRKGEFTAREFGEILSMLGIDSSVDVTDALLTTSTQTLASWNG